MSSTHSKRLDKITCFTDVIRVIGRGATLGRYLTLAESEQVADWLLTGQVDEVQLGAFLMMLRLRGESPEEVAGLSQGFRQGLSVPPSLKADIDWPVYAGKRRQLPWFLLSSLALAKQGKRVVLHGAVGTDEDRLYLEPVIKAMGLPIAHSWAEAQAHLDHFSWVYLPMEVFCPPLVALLKLKQQLGLRSIIHTVVRTLNPLQAPLSVRGVFHQEYVELHAKVAQLQQQDRVIIIRGDGGEAEVSADKNIPILSIHEGQIFSSSLPAIEDVTRPIAENLSVDLVASRLLAILQGDGESERYGTATTARTLAVITEQ